MLVVSARGSAWILTKTLVRDSLLFAVGIITLAKIGITEDLIGFTDLVRTVKSMGNVIERDRVVDNVPLGNVHARSHHRDFYL